MTHRFRIASAGFARLALVISLIAGTVGTTCADQPEELSGHGDAVYDIAFSPDGRLMASGSYDKTVKLWDWSTRRVLATLQEHQDQVFRVGFSADGKTLASCSGDGTAIVWDVESRTSRRVLSARDDVVMDVALSSDGALVATAGSHVRLWNAAQGHQVWSIPHSYAFFSLAFSPDQKSLACGTIDHLHMCRVSDGHYPGELKAGKGMIYQVDFSPEGQWLASASSDGTLILWDAAERKQTSKVKADQSALFSAAFSPDGKHLASGGRERVVRVWSVPGLQLARSLHGPQETILTVNYSPDGRWIATGSYDGKIHLWELAAN